MAETIGLSTKKQPDLLSIWGAMISIYIIWGSTYLAIYFATKTLPPFLMLSARFFTAGGILYVWRRQKGDPAPTRIEWRAAAIIGFLLLVCGIGSVALAEQHVPSGIAALMIGSAPLWMILIDLLLLRKTGQKSRPNRLAYAGIIVGFGGILFLVAPSDLTGLSRSVDTLGAAILIFSSFCWAVGSLFSRSAQLPVSPLLGTGMEMLAGGVGLLLLGTLSGEWRQFSISQVTTSSLLGLAYLIVFGSLIGFAAYTWLLRVAPTTVVSTYAYVNPIVAIFLGNLLDKEPITARILIAASIILSAVALTTLAQPVTKKVERAGHALSQGDD